MTSFVCCAESRNLEEALMSVPDLETFDFKVLSRNDRYEIREVEMVVSITGATGFIGKRLVQRLQEDNHSVRILTRSRSKAQLIFPAKDFPGIVVAEEIEWEDAIQGSTAVVNLAGLPISTRWSHERLETKYSSNPSKEEVEAKTAKGSSSCTNGLLWLTRFVMQYQAVPLNSFILQ